MMSPASAATSSRLVTVVRIAPPYDGNGARHYVLNATGTEASDGSVRVLEEFLPALPFPRRELRLLRLARSYRGRADVFLVDQGNAVRLAMLKLLGIRMPRVASFAYEPFPDRKVPILDSVVVRKCLYRRLDALLLVSRGQTLWIRELFENRPSVEHVPMSIDRQAFRRTVGTHADGAGRVLIVDGSRRDYKVLERGLLTATGVIEFVVVHRLPLSQPKLQVLAAIRERGIKVSVEYRVSTDRLRGLYANASVVVVPMLTSRQPAGLTALLEAMSVGCPIVVTDTNWLREYAKSDECCFVEPGDPIRLANALTRLLESERERTRLANAAAIRAETFTFAFSNEVLREHLVRLAGRRSD